MHISHKVRIAEILKHFSAIPGSDLLQVRDTLKALINRTPSYQIDFEGAEGGCIEIWKQGRKFLAVIKLTSSAKYGTEVGSFSTLEDAIINGLAAPAKGFGKVFDYIEQPNNVLNYVCLRNSLEWKDAKEKLKVIHILTRKQLNSG